MSQRFQEFHFENFKEVDGSEVIKANNFDGNKSKFLPHFNYSNATNIFKLVAILPIDCIYQR